MNTKFRNLRIDFSEDNEFFKDIFTNISLAFIYIPSEKNIKKLDFMFKINLCSSLLKQIPDISNWDIKNFKNMKIILILF